MDSPTHVLIFILAGVEAALIGVTLRVAQVYWQRYRRTDHYGKHVAFLGLSYCLFVVFAMLPSLHAVYDGPHWVFVFPTLGVFAGVAGLQIIVVNLGNLNRDRPTKT